MNEPQIERAGSARPEDVEGFLKYVLRRSWALFIAEPLVYVLASVAVVLLGLVTLGILAGPLSVGMVLMVRKHLHGEQPQIGDIFAGMPHFVPALLTMLIIAVGISIGATLFVLPGVLVGVICAFAFHHIAYCNAGVGDALKASFNIIKDNAANALVLLVILGVLMSIGSSIVLGSLLTTPFTAIATTVAYERFTGAAAPADSAA